MDIKNITQDKLTPEQMTELQKRITAQAKEAVRNNTPRVEEAELEARYWEAQVRIRKAQMIMAQLMPEENAAKNEPTPGEGKEPSTN